VRETRDLVAGVYRDACRGTLARTGNDLLILKGTYRIKNRCLGREGRGLGVTDRELGQKNRIRIEDANPSLGYARSMRSWKKEGVRANFLMKTSKERNQKRNGGRLSLTTSAAGRWRGLPKNPHTRTLKGMKTPHSTGLRR